MTDDIAAEPDRHDTTPPPDGAALATLDWVVCYVDGHVAAVDADDEAAVMGAAWALGFAGATREQVWWALRDARLRTAFVSLCHAMGRIRGAEVPAWLEPLTQLPPAERGVHAARVDALRGDGGARIPAADDVLFAVVQGHPRAVVAPDRSYAAVPLDVADELCEVTRSVTQSDIARLLDRARPPFAQRLEEAAAIAAGEGLAFHVRRSRDAA